ncbi:MAG: VOC family protein [Tissierellales bacterium]|nr:VOC family protein [Tissierellales bacterium]
MQLDHVFIATKRGAKKVDELLNFGLSEGTGNVHPGQGTANRRIFFKNAMLEFIWIENEDEVKSDLTSPTKLYQRCKRANDSVSPFGICLRPDDEEEKYAKFKTWSYHPIYLPEFLEIEMSSDTPLEEPMWFYLGFGRRPDQLSEEKREEMNHKIGFEEITGVRLTLVTDEEWSDAAKMIESDAKIVLERGINPLMVLEFDNKKQGKSKDFRPEIPLIIEW